MMAYASTNFKTKKALKEAIAAGSEVYVYSPGPFPVPTQGRVSIEGPHYPQPHRWYATAILEDGKIIKVS